MSSAGITIPYHGERPGSRRAVVRTGDQAALRTLFTALLSLHLVLFCATQLLGAYLAMANGDLRATFAAGASMATGVTILMALTLWAFVRRSSLYVALALATALCGYLSALVLKLAYSPALISPGIELLTALAVGMPLLMVLAYRWIGRLTHPVGELHRA